MGSNPAFVLEIGPDGIPKESPVISYTEQVLSLSIYSSFFFSSISHTLVPFFSDNRSRATSIEEVTLFSL